MKKLLIILPLLCAPVIYSCKKSDSGPSAPVVSGVNLTDINGTPIGVLGNPNVLTSKDQITFICYPKPCEGSFTLRITTPTAGIVHVWALAGVYPGLPDTITVSNQYLFSQSSPLLQSTQQVEAGVNGFEFRTDSLPNGFYKLYLALNSDTLYDNIWIKK